MTIIESLKNNLENKDFWKTTDLLNKISMDTGLTYESCRCNTFRYKEKLPKWFYDNYTYISNGTGKNSYIEKGKSNNKLEFNKDFVYDYLFSSLNKEYIITTFPGYNGNDVKYLLDNGFNNINCIEKNKNIYNDYIKYNYKTNNYLNKFSNVIKTIPTDVLYYDSCSYFSKYHNNELDIINNLDIKFVFLTFKNINNKWSNYNLIEHIKTNLNNLIYIDELKYVSRFQKMIVMKFEKTI